MKISVRKAILADLPAISHLSKGLFAFEDKFGHEYNLDWTDSEDGQKYLKERLEHKDAIIFISEDQAKIIGYILAFTKTYSYRIPNPICEIENIFVEEAYRGQGVGQLLMDLVKKHAKLAGAKKLRLGMIAQNEKALHFYKANGFGEVNLYLETDV